MSSSGGSDSHDDDILLLCDAGFGIPKEKRPRQEKILAISRQLIQFLSWQESEVKGETRRAAKVKIVGWDEEIKTALEKRLHALWKQSQVTNFPQHVEFCNKSFQQYFEEIDCDVDNLVYLSPDAEAALDPSRRPPRIVIVGLLIDRKIQLHRSRERAENTLHLPTARWPLESPAIHPNIQDLYHTNEPLNVDTVLEGMQQWDWNCQTSEIVDDQCFGKAVYQALVHHEERHPGRPRHRTA